MTLLRKESIIYIELGEKQATLVAYTSYLQYIKNSKYTIFFSRIDYLRHSPMVELNRRPLKKARLEGNMFF